MKILESAQGVLANILIIVVGGFLLAIVFYNLAQLKPSELFIALVLGWLVTHHIESKA